MSIHLLTLDLDSLHLLFRSSKNLRNPFHTDFHNQVCQQKSSSPFLNYPNPMNLYTFRPKAYNRTVHQNFCSRSLCYHIPAHDRHSYWDNSPYRSMNRICPCHTCGVQKTKMNVKSLERLTIFTCIFKKHVNVLREGLDEEIWWRNKTFKFIY